MYPLVEPELHSSSTGEERIQIEDQNFLHIGECMLCASLLSAITTRLTLSLWTVHNVLIDIVFR